MSLALIFLLIIFEALWSGFYDNGKKTLCGVFQMLFLVSLLVALLFTYTWIIIPVYILVRFAVFDLTYNLVRGLKWWYFGNTKPLDKLWTWFFHKTGFPANHFFFWTKLISLIIGISLWLPTINK